MPIVATGEFHLLDMVVLLCFIRPVQALFAEEREHGRTIPLADFRRTKTLETETSQPELLSPSPQIPLHASSARSFSASFRSGVSKPSVNQP
jgi:hypothetical protein